MDITGFLMDHMGHYAPHDIGNGLFALAVAALLGFVLARFGGRTEAAEARSLALWSVVAALALFLAHAQLPVALAMLALVLLARPERAPHPGPLFPLVLITGAACGMGAALIALAFAVPLVLMVRWVLLRPQQ
jgi:hypothetical protein